MKLFFRLLSISILAAAATIAGCAKQEPPATKIPPPPSQQTATVISLTFPTLADVELKTGKSKTGKVTKLTDKQLDIELDGTTDKVNLTEIKKVKFKPKLDQPKGTETRIRSDAETWELSPPNILDIKDGKGEVPVKAIASQQKPGDDALGKPDSYQVIEMEFQPATPMKMKLTVKPIHSPN
jgi:hypothetical protein